MKPFSPLGTAILAFVTVATNKNIITADAFFVAPGGLSTARTSVVGTSSLAHNALDAAVRSCNSAGCTCPKCALGIHGSSCTCSSCRSTSMSARSHDRGCRCSACSVRLQAHGAGCGCGDCSRLHGAACKCPSCASCQSEACSCALCVSGRRRASTTMLSAAGATSEGEVVVSSLRERLVSEPEGVAFEDTMAAVEQAFEYTPKRS